MDNLTRRRLLRRAATGTAAITFGPAFLAACGDSGGGTTTTSAGPAKVPDGTGRLDFLWWEGYDAPDVFKPWAKQQGITVKPTYIAGQDDVQAKIKAAGGSSGFDLSGYANGYKPLYSELKLFPGIDDGKLPNLANLAEYFAGKEGNFWVDEDGRRTGVPWTWGTFGINYDTAEVDAADTYELLTDPKYKGRVGVVDDQTAVLCQACRFLGLDESRLTQDDLAKVVEFVTAAVKQSRGVAPNYGDLTNRFTSGEIVLAFPGWAAMNKFAADGGKKTIKTALPKEKGFTYVDAFFVPPDADNADAAYAWINHALDPKVNGEANTGLIAASTVTKGETYQDKAVAELFPYDKLAAGELDSVAPLIKIPPVKSSEFVTFQDWLTKWQEIKQGA